MNIALDYDGTYTRDPQMWDEFIANAVKSGHIVQCVTMRYPSEAVVMPCPVIYTSRQAKVRHCLMAGIEFHVWIDDNPLYIYQGA